MPFSHRSNWALPLPPRVRADGWGAPMGIVRPYVGADPEAAAKAYITATDDEVRNVPLFKWVIELQDWVFHIADKFGVGDQVRRLVYDGRAVGYGTVYASPVLYPVAAGVTAAAGNTAAGAAAGPSTLAIAGGIASLGAAAVVVGIADALFGGDEDAAKDAVKVAQQQALRLRDRLTLAQFASEQDESAKVHSLLAILPWKDGTKEKQAAALAQKLAAFYREVDQGLDADKRAAFESIANLSRWEGALIEYEKLSWPKKDEINILFGTSAPRLPTQLNGTVAAPGPIPKEQAALKAILARHAAGEADPPSPLWSATKALLALSVGGLLGIYLLEPALARSILAKVATTATRLPTQAIQTAKKVLP